MYRDVSLFLFFLLLAACDGAQPADPEATELLGCVDPSVAGALPDDGLDDRDAIQSVLDDNPLGVSLCLRPGRYELSRRGGNTHRRISSLSIESSNVHIAGAGWTTELALVGSGGGGDWNGIEIKSSPSTGAPVAGVTIRDLMITAGDSFQRDEQTHLIAIGAGYAGSAQVSDVQVSRVAFFMPQLAGEKGGDCIRILGGQDKPVTRVQISDNQFIACDRSSIGVQRWTSDIIIDGNMFAAVGDQHIDFEPTGTGSVDRYVITGNIFTGGTQGKIHVSIVGNSDTEAAADVLFANNMLAGRGLFMLNVRRAVVTSNIITAEMGSAAGLIDAIKVQDSLVVSGNVLRRWAGPPGAVLSISVHNSGMPGQLLVSGNQFIQESAGSLLSAEGAQDLTVSNNVFQYLGPAGTGYAAISLRAVSRPADRFLVLGNRVLASSSAPLASFLQLHASPYSIGAVSVVGNMTEGVGVGLRCEGSGGFTHRIVHAANYYDGASAAVSTCDPANIVAQYP
jgi:hypothetical protein